MAKKSMAARPTAAIIGTYKKPSVKPSSSSSSAGSSSSAKKKGKK